MDKLLMVIRESWGWIGVDPEKVITENSFGNVIVADVNGKYWRICPEECSCEQIAESNEEFSALMKCEDFREDWAMERVVEAARLELGPLPDDRAYCLKMPACLGGAYDMANFGTAPRTELISFSGDISQQLKDVPEGTQVRLEFI